MSGREASGDHAPAGRRPKSGVRILQCNDELCQYEMRPNADIIWAEHQTNMVKHTWDDRPKAALIIKKPGDPKLTLALKVCCIMRSPVIGCLNRLARGAAFETLGVRRPWRNICKGPWG